MRNHIDSAEILTQKHQQHNSTTNTCSHMHQRRNGSSNSIKSSGNSSNSMYGNNRGGNNNYNYNRLEGGGMSAAETNANILEQQNNDRISELSDHVARLKGLTIDIGNEVREQNRLLDNMSDGFSGAKDLLSGSLKRIGNMLERGGAKHMCYMVAFVVFVMVLLYFLMTHKGTSGV